MPPEDTEDNDAGGSRPRWPRSWKTPHRQRQAPNPRELPRLRIRPDRWVAWWTINAAAHKAAPGPAGGANKGLLDGLELVLVDPGGAMGVGIGHATRTPCATSAGAMRSPAGTGRTAGTVIVARVGRPSDSAARAAAPSALRAYVGPACSPIMVQPIRVTAPLPAARASASPRSGPGRQALIHGLLPLLGQAREGGKPVVVGRP